MSVKTKDILPPLLEHNLKALGQNLRIARKRRGWSVEKVRRDVCCSKGTLQDAEAGKPTVSLAVYVLLLDLYGFELDLAALSHPSKDEIGLSLEIERVSGRAVRDQGPPIDPADM